MKKRKRDYDAYLTVEASFLVPIIFVVMVYLIYWGFYCYDKSVSIQCSYLATLRASNEWEMSNAGKEETAIKQLERLTEQTLLFIKPEETYAYAGLTEVKAGIRGGMSIGGARKEKKWTIESEKKSFCLKPASFIRRYRVFKEE